MQKSDQAHLSDDADLVARCLYGDPAGFEKLVDRHGPRLKRLLRAMLRDLFEVEDVYQEALLRAYLNLDQLRDPDRFGAWVYSIAVNLARSSRATNASPAFASLDDFKFEQLAESGLEDHSTHASETRLVQLEEAKRVQQIIADLPTAEREAVLMVYLEGMSHKEVAQQLGTSLSAVKVRVHRGRRRLRDAFTDRFEPVTKRPVMEDGMIEVKIHDMLVHALEESDKVVLPQPQGIDQETAEKWKEFVSRISPRNQYVVLLKEEKGERALPIWIGSFEGEAIVLILKQTQIARPLTFDLMKTLLDVGGVHVERVEINRLHENVFYANLILKTEQGASEIDCRPSDALNLALRLGMPVFVAAEIMETQSRMPEKDGSYVINLEKPEMVWQSLLTEQAS
jgi:RNA polymerase sigma factor (sigma-70 family)